MIETPLPLGENDRARLAGRWIEIVYDASLLHSASRPRLILRHANGSRSETSLPAPLLGRAIWIGHIPKGAIGAHIESERVLRIERVAALHWLALLARAAWRNPRHTAAATALALTGRPMRARRRLARATTEAPLCAYAKWAGSRRRPYEPNGLDATLASIDAAAIDAALADDEILLPHARHAVAHVFAEDPALNAIQGDVEIEDDNGLSLGLASAWTPVSGAVFRRPGAPDCAPRPFRGVLTRRTKPGMVGRQPRPDPVVWPRVTVIVPTRDRLDLLETCINGVLSCTDYPALALVIADNDSSDEATKTYMDALPQRDSRAMVIACPGAFNFSRICNRAAAASDGDILVFLNNDIEIHDPSWLKAMARVAMDTRIGAVGPTLVFPNGTIQHAGVALGPGGGAGHVLTGRPLSQIGAVTGERAVSAVTGACLAVRRTHFEAVGGFDEAFAVTYNDIDLCLRLNAGGWPTVWLPEIRLLHRESATRGHTARHDAATALFAERWAQVIADDPHYHPAFSRYALDLALD